MKSTALKIFLAFYGLFFLGLLCVVLCISQSDLHIALTLDYLSNFSPDWVAFQDIFFKYMTEWGSWVPFVVVGVLLFYKVGDSLFVLLPQLLLGIVVRIIKVNAAAPRPSLYFSTHFLRCGVASG